MKKMILTIFSFTLIAALLLTGCGNTTGTAAPANTSQPAASGTTQSTATAQPASNNANETPAIEKQVVKVGIGNGYNPFCFVDENEDPAGYDYESLQILAPYLSDKYEFVFYPDAFQNLLIGLDTGTYDAAVHHFGWTAARAENYLYADESTMYFGNFIIGYSHDVTTVTDDIESIAGLSIVTGQGSMAETLLNNYNETHPDAQVIIEALPDSNSEVWANGVINGLYDGVCMSVYDLAVFNEQYGDIVTGTSFKLSADDYNCGTYFIYSKGSDELKNDIDAAIVQARAGGALAQLSVKWLGDDYTVNPNA